MNDNDNEKKDLLAILNEKLNSREEANLAVRNRHVIDLFSSIPVNHFRIIEGEQLKKLLELESSLAAAHVEVIRQRILATQMAEKYKRIEAYKEMANREVDAELDELKRRSEANKMAAEQARIEAEHANAIKELEMRQRRLEKERELKILENSLQESIADDAEIAKLENAVKKVQLEIEQAELAVRLEKVKNPPEPPVRKSREDRIMEVTKAKHKFLAMLKKEGVSESDIEYKRAELRFEQQLHNLMS